MSYRKRQARADYKAKKERKQIERQSAASRLIAPQLSKKDVKHAGKSQPVRTNGPITQTAHASQPTIQQMLSKPNVIAEWFKHHDKFNYNRNGEIWAQFRDLVDVYDWDEGEEGYHRRRLRDAMVEQFNIFYGTDADDLGSWQELCRVMRFSVIPATIPKCRAAIRGVYVNLVDLVDTIFTGKPVTLHPSEVSLSEYTLATEKIFPRENAKAGGLLERLLRHIFHPRAGIRIAEIMQQRQQERRNARRGITSTSRPELAQDTPPSFIAHRNKDAVMDSTGWE